MYINLSIYKYMSSVAMCTIYAIYDIIRIRIPYKGLENYVSFPRKRKCYSKYIWRKINFEVILFLFVSKRILNIFKLTIFKLIIIIANFLLYVVRFQNF